VCPTEAIYYEDDVPEKWDEFKVVNTAFFETLGSPGGASKTGKTSNDPESIASLPPQVS
jgi:hypothetical protein